jgi:hypothetical protein
MTKLKELERRLRDEPENLGLRVMVASALHEAGRRGEAAELYRSVAIAYRDQGRPQQAILVCRRVLELAPDDGACKALLASLLAAQAAPRESPLPERLAPSPGGVISGASRMVPGDTEPARRSSSGDVTPLPQPLAYHDADPTSSPRLATALLPEQLALYPEIAGIANAARQISASLIAASRRAELAAEARSDDLAVELDTRRMPRITAAELDKIAGPPPAITLDSIPAEPGDDDPTIPPPLGAARIPGAGDAQSTTPASGESARTTAHDEPSNATGVPGSAIVDDERTLPRELPRRAHPPSIAPSTTATGPLASAFFVPLPPQNRAAILQRFRRRIVAIGTTVIRRGEAGHGLIIVVRGRLELHADRSDGVRISLGGIGPGEYIGEVGLLARAPAATQVIAALDSELLVLAAGDFYEVTAAFPALSAELRSVAERRTRELEHRIKG